MTQEYNEHWSRTEAIKHRIRDIHQHAIQLYMGHQSEEAYRRIHEILKGALDELKEPGLPRSTEECEWPWCEIMGWCVPCEGPMDEDEAGA